MKNLAILLLTCGLVFWLGSRVVLQPEQLDNARQEQKLRELQRQVNEGRAALKALPLFREEVARLEQEADRWLSAVPAGSGVAELLSRLSEIGMASGVTLEGRAAAASDESETAAQVTVSGSRRQMRAFFAALRDEVYPFVAGEFELFPVEGKRDLLQAGLVVSPAPAKPGGVP